MLSIVADANIPLVSQAFQSIGDVVVLNAELITPEVCREADVLLVRSVTPVNQSLVARSNISFVGSATAGIDHVDQDALGQQGIHFSHAPGSNADSVVEYVITALIQLSTLKSRPLGGLTLGIVGCGHVGGRLAQRAPALGLKILKNDPPLAQQSADEYVDLHTVLTMSDIVTFHVPKSPDTYHMITEAELRSMKSSAWILNTSRGDVLDNQDLKAHLSRGELEACVLDVWENEPTPDPELLKRVTFATPHIAGHSVDGKLQGTMMLYHAVIEHFGLQPSWDHQQSLQKDLPSPLSIPPQSNWLSVVARHLYDLESDDARMRNILCVLEDQMASRFRDLRRNYPPRRSFHLHTLKEVPREHLRAVRDGLQVHYLYPKERRN